MEAAINEAQPRKHYFEHLLLHGFVSFAFFVHFERGPQLDNLFRKFLNKVFLCRGADLSVAHLLVVSLHALCHEFLLVSALYEIFIQNLFHRLVSL